MNKKRLEEFNKQIIEQTDREYKKFKSTFELGKCYLCGLPLDKFDFRKPCLHWLLAPSGFKKKYFHLIYEKFDHFQFQSYLRWIANTENFAGNINDLVAEKSSSKVIEVTIKYKIFEWSFSCSKTDFKGHFLSTKGRRPHYHFQMRINNKPFINYRDFHIPLSENDLITINIIKGEVKGLEYSFGPGIGIEEALDYSSDLLKNMRVTSDESKATYHIQTIIEAKPGKVIKGEDIAELLKESKKTGILMSGLAKKLKGVKIKRIIMPGPGIPNIAKRLGGRKKSS